MRKLQSKYSSQSGAWFAKTTFLFEFITEVIASLKFSLLQFLQDA